MEYVLGLDLGCSSVGWAVVQYSNGTPLSLLDAGVRVFPEGKLMEKGREKSRNAQRRDARQARRQIDRRRRRRRKLTAILRSAGLLPRNRDQLKELFATNP